MSAQHFEVEVKKPPLNLLNNEFVAFQGKRCSGLPSDDNKIIERTCPFLIREVVQHQNYALLPSSHCVTLHPGTPLPLDDWFDTLSNLFCHPKKTHIKCKDALTESQFEDKCLLNE